MSRLREGTELSIHISVLNYFIQRMQDRHDRPSEHEPFLPDIIRLKQGLLRLGKERKRQAVFFHELLVGFCAVGIDAFFIADLTLPPKNYVFYCIYDTGIICFP